LVGTKSKAGLGNGIARAGAAGRVPFPLGPRRQQSKRSSGSKRAAGPAKARVFAAAWRILARGEPHRIGRCGDSPSIGRKQNSRLRHSWPYGAGHYRSWREPHRRGQLIGANHADPSDSHSKRHCVAAGLCIHRSRHIQRHGRRGCADTVSALGLPAHILQFSSVGGRIGPVGRAPYAAAKWGVEGFSEVLSKEVGPLGVKVTIIEPGGFRTDFAGSSTAIREGRPEYDATVGKTARFQRDYDGKQPGDPAKAAAAVLHIASLKDPPLRLLLGSDAFRFVKQNDLAKMESDRKWKDLSISTDIEQVAEEAGQGK
jgi:NAD(P)-dependent dehydrogenase (short-subunit alcohol dehydrogenase family)